MSTTAVDPASAAVDFVSGVSSQTGIDPRVLTAWVQAEGAYAPNGTGGFNFLNLRPYPGDPYSSVSSGNFEQFSSVGDAIAATVRRLEQPFAAPIIRAAKQNAPPANQIAAIASTGWDSGHYGGPGGPNLISAFKSLFGSGALVQRYTGQTSQLAPSSPFGPSSITGDISKAAGSIVNAIPGVKQGEQVASAFDSIGKFLAEITSVKFLVQAGEVIAGAVMIAVGVVLLARQVGLSMPSVPSPIVAAAGAVA